MFCDFVVTLYVHVFIIFCDFVVYSSIFYIFVDVSTVSTINYVVFVIVVPSCMQACLYRCNRSKHTEKDVIKYRNRFPTMS